MKNPELKGRDILLDANLLVVLLIGLTRSTLFGKKPVSDYTITDFEILRTILKDSRMCLTTPYLVAEASNLVGKAGNFYAEECRGALGKLLTFWSEEYIVSQKLFQNKSIAIRFGAADASIVEAARKGAVILTADNPLAGLLAKENLDVWSMVSLRMLMSAG